MFNRNRIIVALTLLVLCVVVFAPIAKGHEVTTSGWCTCWPPGVSVAHYGNCWTLSTCAVAYCSTTTTCHSH